MTPEQEQKLNKVIAFMDALQNSTTIPLEVDAAFRARLESSLSLTVSAKGLNEEDVTVNESGSSSYAVLGDPDGFLQVTISGTTYYLPYFT